MSRQPSPLGTVQQKIPILILPEEFGASEQEVNDCLAGLAAHDELCRERADFSGWVKNRISDAMDAARQAGKGIREEREAVEAEGQLQTYIKGLAEHFGMTAEAVKDALTVVSSPPKKKK